MTQNELQSAVDLLAKYQDGYDKNTLQSMRDYLYTLDSLDNLLFREQQAVQRDIETYKGVN
jgi:hypothetical protein